MLKKIVFLAAVLMILEAVVSSAALAQGGKQTPPRVLIDKVVSKQPTIYRKYTAEFEPIEKVTSLARISGILEKINFKEGDIIEKGQTLFEIESVRYEAAVKAAQSKIDVIKARIRYAQNTYDRNKTLAEQKAVANDTAENTLSILEGYQAELLGAEADLTLAKEDLAYTKMVSQLKGRVGRVNFTEGNYITPASGPLVTVVQINPIYVRFSMSERDFTTLFGTFAKLKETAKLSVQLANGEYYKGKGEISFVDNQMSQHTNTLQIWATYENPEGILNPGGLATILMARTDTVEKPAVVMSAVMFDRQGHFVYTTEKRSFDDKDREGNITGKHDGFGVVRRDVTLGPTDGEFQVIETGLKMGEEIIVDGTHKAVPGDEITPIPVTKTFEGKAEAETSAPAAKPAEEKAKAETPAPAAKPAEEKAKTGTLVPVK